MPTFKFNGNPISEDQFNTLKQIGTLGGYGIVSKQQAPQLIAQTLLTKPNNFQQNLAAFVNGGGNSSAPTAAPSTGTPKMVITPFTGNANNTAAAPKPAETPGTFGFGTGKGQLFGEGGLGDQITMPFRQLINAPLNYWQLAAKTAGGVLGGNLDTVLKNEGFDANSIARNPLDIANWIKQGSTALSNQQNIGISKEQQKEFYKDPILNTAKAAVGVATTLAAPGVGTGLTRAITTGGIIGGGQGFANSKAGNELNDTLAGTVGGAITGGVLNKVVAPLASKIGEKLGVVGDKLEGSIFNVDPNKLKYSKYSGVTGAKELEGQAQKVLTELGDVPATKFQVAEAVDRGINTLQNKAGELTKGFAKPIETAPIFDKILGEFKNAPDVIQKGQRYLSDLIDLGNKPTAEALSKYYFDIQNKINFNRTTTAVPEVEEVLRAIQNHVGEALKSSSTGVPGLADTFAKLSVLHEVQPFATRAATTTSKLGGAFPIINNLNPAPLTDRLQTGAGKVLSGVSNISPPQAASRITSQVAPRLGAAFSVSQSRPQVPSANPNGGVSLPSTVTPESLMSGQSNDILKQIIQSGVASGDISPTEGKAYLDLYGASDAAKKERTVTDLQKISSAKGALNSIQQIQDLFNNGAALQGNLPSFLQSGDTQKLELATRNAIDQLLRARTGATANPSEIESYRQFFPVFGDDPATVQAKLERAYNELYPIASLQ